MDEKIAVQSNNVTNKPDCHVSAISSPDVFETKTNELAGASYLVAAGNFFFKYRNIVLPMVFCGLAIIDKPLVIDSKRHLDIYLDLIGIAIALAGQSLRICVIGFAYIKRGGKDKKVYATTLVQEGFFAHCRNPLYVGNILTLFGLIIIHGGMLMYCVCLPFCLFLYWTIIIAEENYLHGKFGRGYEDYCKKVPRFLISFKGIEQTLASMQYNWKRVIRKEYGTIFVLVTTVMALLVWERITADGFEATMHYSSFMLMLWVPVVLGYFAAFALKKKTAILGKD